MQRFNVKLYSHLSKISNVSLISWGGSQAILPFFLTFAFLRGLFLCWTKPIQCIYVSDGLLSPLGLLLKVLTRKPVVCNIHGRDIAFEFAPYQIIVPWCLQRVNRVICVSQALKEECLKRKVSEKILTVIPNGVDLEDFNNGGEGRERLEEMVGISLEDKKVLLTVGRLVPKKGVDAFISNVLPRIVQSDPSIIYLVAGDGPLKARIESMVTQSGLQNHVFLLGKVLMEGGLLTALYQEADVFVMPNVPVADDMEGFGIVALEAGASALPVVASKVDGIAEAVRDGENGILLEHTDHQGFADTIQNLLRDEPGRLQFGQRAKDFVRDYYSWGRIAQQYWVQFEKIAQRQKESTCSSG